MDGLTSRDGLTTSCSIKEGSVLIDLRDQVTITEQRHVAITSINPNQAVWRCQQIEVDCCSLQGYPALTSESV